MSDNNSTAFAVWTALYQSQRGPGWDPRALPFRVTRYVSSPLPGLYGWRDEVCVFATEVEARQMVDVALAIRGTTQARLDMVTWRGDDWGWRMIPHRAVGRKRPSKARP